NATELVRGPGRVDTGAARAHLDACDRLTAQSQGDRHRGSCADGDLLRLNGEPGAIRRGARADGLRLATCSRERHRGAGPASVDDERHLALRVCRLRLAFDA